MTALAPRPSGDRLLLVLSEVSVRVGGLLVLQGIDLAIRAGTTTAVIGPNGSGKTTLFNVISGFLRADQGEIFFRGRRIDRLDPAAIVRLGIARTFQDIRVFGHLSVRDNLLLAMEDEATEGLRFGLDPFRRYTEEALDVRMADLMKQARLDLPPSHPAALLSRGQRKLIELLRTVALDVELLLLDEPFSGVFPAQREVMSELLRQLVRDGRSILFVEHDMNAVSKLADRVVMLHSGRVIADGSPRQVLENPQMGNLYFEKDEPA